MKRMLELFKSARQVSVPLVVIRTSDQWATIDAIRATEEHPLVQWDAARGLTEVNKAGKDALQKANVKASETIGFVDAMDALPLLPPRTIAFAHNAHRQLQAMEPKECAQAVQAVSNLRDTLKMNFRMLVLLGPDFLLPPELAHDVVVLDHELPLPEELATVVKEVVASVSSLKKPTPEVIAKSVDALSGLTAFESEQVTAMSLTKDGPDAPSMWERKRVTIELTPGLSVYKGKETFADIIGQEALKQELRLRIRGKRPLGVVVWIDEIDKALANVESDTSGVRMYQLMKMLTEMENNEWPGFVGVGVAGAGKSLIAKALGNEAGVPTIALDLGASESKYVGESEANLNRIIAIIKAVGRGNAYFVATSNAATVMRPELQRRFFDGMWMFDLMTKEERQAAWKFFIGRYGLKVQPLPDDEGWTGAEIRNACRRADDVGCTLVQAARTIVPMATQRAEEIERLRQGAHGKFLDVNKGGKYQYTREPMARQVRAIELPPSVAALVPPMKES